MLCKTFCNVNKSLDITRSDKQDGCLIFEKSYHRNKTSNENHWKDHCGQALVGIYWGINCIGNEKRFLLCSQVWHSLIFCQSRFSEQRTKTRSRAVWSCFYHEVSKMWVMWNPTICIHNVSRPETDMITVWADIDECFIFFKIIYIGFWKK